MWCYDMVLCCCVVCCFNCLLLCVCVCACVVGVCAVGLLLCVMVLLVVGVRCF